MALAAAVIVATIIPAAYGSFRGNGFDAKNALSRGKVKGLKGQVLAVDC